MGIVSTLALFGLFSLLIPLILHLVNPGKGRLVWVGNIKLLQGSKKKRVRELRIERWLLLLLRLGIFALLTLIVAELYIHGHYKLLESRKILVTQDWLAQADEQQKTALGSQYQVLPGKMLWQQLALLDKQLPKNLVFSVYTTDSLYNFDVPVKPVIEREVGWHILQNPVARASQTEQSLTVYGAKPSNSISTALEVIQKHRMPGLQVRYKLLPGENTEPSDWVIYTGELPLPKAIAEQAIKGSTVLVENGLGESKPWGDGYIIPFHVSSDATFVDQLLDMLLFTQSNVERFEQPVLMPVQIKTSHHNQTQAQQQVKKTPLSEYLWLLLIVLWLAERFVAERTLAARLEENT